MLIIQTFLKFSVFPQIIRVEWLYT